MATATTTTITLAVISTAVTAVRRVWVAPSRRITANNASVWIRTPKRQNHQHVETKSTRAMTTATTTTITLAVTSTAVTAVRRVWAAPSRRITANNASVWIRTPKRQSHQHVVSKSTRAMATATTTTITLAVTSTAVTAVRRVWAAPSRR